MFRKLGPLHLAVVQLSFQLSELIDDSGGARQMSAEITDLKSISCGLFLRHRVLDFHTHFKAVSIF